MHKQCVLGWYFHSTKNTNTFSALRIEPKRCFALVRLLRKKTYAFEKFLLWRRPLRVCSFLFQERLVHQLFILYLFNTTLCKKPYRNQCISVGYNNIYCLRKFFYKTIRFKVTKIITNSRSIYMRNCANWSCRTRERKETNDAYK